MEGKPNKTKIIIAGAVVLVIIAIIVGIIIFNANKNNEGLGPNAGSISEVDSDFEKLKIQDIELSYDEENNETVIDFSIKNLTDEKIEKQKVEIQLLDKDDSLISSIETYVTTVDPQSNSGMNMTLAGNIQGIKKMKLVKPQEETPAQ